MTSSWKRVSWKKGFSTSDIVGNGWKELSQIETYLNKLSSLNALNWPINVSNSCKLIQAPTTKTFGLHVIGQCTCK
jgi:hypothetical protein